MKCYESTVYTAAQLLQSTTCTSMPKNKSWQEFGRWFNTRENSSLLFYPTADACFYFTFANYAITCLNNQTRYNFQSAVVTVHTIQDSQDHNMCKYLTVYAAALLLAISHIFGRTVHHSNKTNFPIDRPIHPRSKCGEVKLFAWRWWCRL